MRQLDSLGLRAERVDTLSALMQSCIPTAQRPGVDLLFLSSQFDGGNPLKEAVSLLHALHATPPLIVLLSRAGRESERQQGPGKGHDAILLKPIRLAVLRDTIVSLCHDPHARRLANLDRRDLAPPLAGAFPLQRLPGLDVARGLQRAGGSWRLYLEGLSACCRAYRSLTAQIQELLAQNDFASACQRAQELKDDAAHIAAHRLCAAARALQVSCARHDDSRIAARLRFVQTSLQQLERSAAQLGCDGSALPVAPSGAAIAPAPALMEALIALDHSLQELDPVRSDQCLQTVKTWGDHMGFEFGINELERQIQHYDFAGARQTLQRLLTLSS